MEYVGEGAAVQTTDPPIYWFSRERCGPRRVGRVARARRRPARERSERAEREGDAVERVPPTHASWMNLVEVWFGMVERQAMRRGVFKSVKDLNAKIRTFIDGWNDRSHAFVWTKTAEEILKKANRPTTSNPRH